MNKPTRKVKPYPETPPDLPIDMDEDNKPEPFTVADYFVFAVVIAITGWFLWEVLT